MKNSAKTILMVRPANFGLNQETALDNAFQKQNSQSSDEIRQKAINEFDSYINKLKSHGLDIIVVNDTNDPIKPDAIFPNNWFSTHTDGKIYLYPMKAMNRRHEKNNPVIKTLSNHFKIDSIIDLTDSEKDDLFLEGTGSIIFDHIKKFAYAAISKRTDKDLFIEHCKQLGYTPISFKATDDKGQEIYHTNVLMSVTSHFTVICLETIKDVNERQQLINHFKNINQKMIEVSYEQLAHFCCNILEVQDSKGKLWLTMSQRAFNNFNPQQLKEFRKTHQILSCDLSTIEDNGGGSSRCMMAEIYLPK